MRIGRQIKINESPEIKPGFFWTFGYNVGTAEPQGKVNLF